MMDEELINCLEEKHLKVFLAWVHKNTKVLVLCMNNISWKNKQKASWVSLTLLQYF